MRGNCTCKLIAPHFQDMPDSQVILRIEKGLHCFPHGVLPVARKLAPVPLCGSRGTGASAERLCKSAAEKGKSKKEWPSKERELPRHVGVQETLSGLRFFRLSGWHCLIACGSAASSPVRSEALGGKLEKVCEDLVGRRVGCNTR